MMNRADVTWYSRSALAQHLPPDARSRLLTPIARRITRPILISVLVAACYYLGSKLGFFLTPRESPIATYWPANAILMASFLLIAPRLWGALIIPVLGAHLLVQGQNGVPLATAFGWFIGNISEALLGAGLLYRFSNRQSLFNSVRGVLLFLSCGVFLAPFVTSFIDAAIVVITRWGSNFWMLWMTRLFSNMLAALTIVPAVVAIVTTGIEWIRKASAARRLEALMLAVSVILVTMRVFGGHNPSPHLVPALVYAPLPFLLWAALRFGAGGLGASVALIAFISFYDLIQGRGPLASASMIENVLFLQILLGTVTVPLMLLSAVLSERQRTEQMLRESRGKLLEAQEQERRRIARELHDDIGQRLSLVELELRRLRNAAEEGTSFSGLRFPLAKLVRQVDAISEATRELSHDLHPIQLEYLGLVPALRRFCSEIQHQASMTTALHESGPLRPLNSNVALCLFRIAQEALHNVVKHSHARNARVELSAENNHLLMRIIDDGVGFVPERIQSTGLGLTNMKERLNSIGGTLKINSAPLKGTVVEASINLDGEKD